MSAFSLKCVPQKKRVVSVTEKAWSRKWYFEHKINDEIGRMPNFIIKYGQNTIRIYILWGLKYGSRIAAVLTCVQKRAMLTHWRRE
jgi:hypothetical protein